MLSDIITWLFPDSCLSCNSEGQLLCLDCRDRLNSHPEICFGCKKTQSTSGYCQNCQTSSGLFSLKACYQFDNLAKQLVYEAKYQLNPNAPKLISQLILESLGSTFWQDFDLISFIPSSRQKLRLRGSNIVKTVARNLSIGSGLPIIALLNRTNNHELVGLNRADRVKTIIGSFELNTKAKSLDLAEVRLLLIDDVLTSGATLQEAAKTLSGYDLQVSGLVFAHKLEPGTESLIAGTNLILNLP